MSASRGLNGELEIRERSRDGHTIEQRAQHIRDCTSLARLCIVEIGTELVICKDLLAHGEWLPWLEREFGWSISTAERYIEVARAFGQIRQNDDFAGLTIDATALYALAKPTVPQVAREEAVQRASTGEHITAAKAREIVERVAPEPQSEPEPKLLDPPQDFRWIDFIGRVNDICRLEDFDVGHLVEKSQSPSWYSPKHLTNCREAIERINAYVIGVEHARRNGAAKPLAGPDLAGGNNLPFGG